MEHRVSSLGQLAYISSVYEAMTDYGTTYREFSSQVDGTPNLNDEKHRLALLHWLNAWGCRHLALSCHDHVSCELRAWYERAQDRFPSPLDRLLGLSDQSLRTFDELFDDLSSLHARQVSRNGSFVSIPFGPTAASKSLFALFPHVFVAWDEPIRNVLKYDRKGASYVEFLKRLRGDLEFLAKECARAGFALEELPDRLGRKNSTAPQLVGEHYWVTITRGVRPPDRSTLSEWLSWS